MRIDSTTPSPSPSQLTTPTATKDQFLRLFVAQLENQNPLEPQSGADMVAQLATFSQVEQSVETNKRLTELASAQNSTSTAGLANLVGREVTADATTLTIDGNPPPIEIATTTGRVTEGEMVIRNASGNEVQRIPFGNGPSPLAVSWDGRDSRGTLLPRGSYSIELVAADGTASLGRAQMRGIIDAVELGDEGPRLRIGGARITPAAVTTIQRTGVST